MVDFYLGTHMPGWLGKTDVPLFISRRRLCEVKNPYRALGRWALDSGGFTELNMFGNWETTPAHYASEVDTWTRTVGNLDWAAIQDWMCEPSVLNKTKKTVKEHQDLTIRSYFDLKNLSPDAPWAPVLQGWDIQDYLDHLDAYYAAGVELHALPVVGIGSVCRRQHVKEIAELIDKISGLGVKLHGFGFKTKGLKMAKHALKSADSLAWSFGARYAPPLEGCSHKNCANCFKYAMQWREKLLAGLL